MEFESMDRYTDFPWNVFKDMGFGESSLQNLSTETEREMTENLRKLLLSGIFPSSRYRIFVRYYVRNLSSEQIAASEKKSENQIRRELSKIRHILRKDMLKICPKLPGKDGDEFPTLKVMVREQQEGTIDELELSVRTYSCLMRAGYRTVASVVLAGRRRLLQARNMGERQVEEIARKVKEKYSMDLF